MTFIERFRYKQPRLNRFKSAWQRSKREELLVLPEQSHHMHFELQSPHIAGDTVISLEGVAKSYEDNFV